MNKLFALMLIALLAVTPAFANPNTRDKTIKGAAIGGVAGAIVGGVLGNNRGSGNAKRGAAIGGVVGTATGAIVGAMMDRQERELRQIDGLDVTRIDEDELKVTVRNEVLFDFDSAALRPASRTALREMAEVFDRYRDTIIVVTGHTDSLGTAAYNQRLSERRAGSVSSYLQNLGVRGSRIDAIGNGESQPRATNGTAAGRQLNRRVDIHVRASAA
ncbi:MAG TPA: OmpA family protein [Thermoanaerobaculia bacterium]|nr:OmpA family protein [Thermoanaerobaculia bacterium]